MQILIVSATASEIQPLLKVLSQGSPQVTGEPLHYAYKNIHLDVLCTGVGMVNTAYQLGKTSLQKYQLALNAGIAGSFNKSLDIGSVVQVAEDEFPELGAEDHDAFLSLTSLGLQDENTFPFVQNRLVNAVAIHSKTFNTLPRVKGITVNTVHGEARHIEKTMKNFAPDIESMEGAAFFQVCMTEKIPCAQIRAISNYVEPRNRNAWNIPLAVEQLNQKLISILDDISESQVL